MNKALLLIFFAAMTISCTKKVSTLRRELIRINNYNDSKLLELRLKSQALSDTVIEVYNGDYYWIYRTNKTTYVTRGFKKKPNYMGPSKFVSKSMQAFQDFDTLTKFIAQYQVDTIQTSPRTEYWCDHCVGFSFAMFVKKDTVVNFYLEGMQIERGDSTHIKWKLARLTTDYLNHNYQ